MKPNKNDCCLAGLVSCTCFCRLPVSLSRLIRLLPAKKKKAGYCFLTASHQDGQPPAVSRSGWLGSKDGTLTAKKGGKGGDIISANQYADFDLMLDYNIEPEGNSGVKYFYTTYETGGNLGMEYQILDDQASGR